jgi:hypothetical protein
MSPANGSTQVGPTRREPRVTRRQSVDRGEVSPPWGEVRSARNPSISKCRFEEGLCRAAHQGGGLVAR